MMRTSFIFRCSAATSAGSYNTLGFFGSGAMAYAMARGVVNGKLFPHHAFCDQSKERLEICKQLDESAFLTQKSSALIEKSDVVVIAVKPQFALEALSPVKHLFKENHLVVSVMGGVPIKKIREWCGPHCRIIRTMPNTPLLVGQGATVFAGDDTTSVEDRAIVQKMFESAGFCAEVPENLIDPITGLSGAGPAFLSVFLEALADGAVKVGVPRPVARKFATETVLGTGEMALHGGKDGGPMHPAMIKELTCSPGGMSIRGVDALEQGNMRSAVMNAVTEASVKAQAMGKKV